MHTSSAAQVGFDCRIEPVVRLWTLRILVLLEGHREFVGRSRVDSEEIAQAIGLIAVDDSDAHVYDRRSVILELRRLHAEAEEGAGTTTAPECLHRNVSRLAELVGLDATDCAILEFALLLHAERLMDEATKWLGTLSTTRLIRALSVILNLPESSVANALSIDGRLARTGLVSVDRRGAGVMLGKLDLLSEGLADIMTTADVDPVAILQGDVTKCDPPELSLDDYEFSKPMLDLLRTYLGSVTATGKAGSNVFLHGMPGTGKTQLARILAAELGYELFEVACQGSCGEPLDGLLRLRSYLAAQSLLAKRKVLILFDEAEDVFGGGDALFGRRSPTQKSKSWTNAMLQDNPIPTIWVSNSASDLDAAFIRRFDVFFELKAPPIRHHQRILKSACGDFLSDTDINRIAATEGLSPAVVSRAASVVNAIRPSLDTKGAGQAFERLLSNTLEAQGHRPIETRNASRLPEVYDPRLIHSDVDLEALANGLASSRYGRLCLYGPPGTGKTAYAKWLARHMGMPILVRKASDLMSQYVGQSEKAVARAFQQADQDGAMLVIDEVDSFLQDRRNATHGWEVRLVNEMLTQMESFSGVFVASTNSMHSLDQASLRRFDLKIKFDYLRADQAWALLTRYCGALGLAHPDSETKARLSRLDRLTPGDFAAVVRAHQFRPIAGPSQFLSALASECAVKEASKRPIGFLGGIVH